MPLVLCMKGFSALGEASPNRNPANPGQGVSAELAPRLAAAVAAGAARYGHVMHPEVAHEPALAVAERLLAGPGAGWAARVFFSDDGCATVGQGRDQTW